MEERESERKEFIFVILKSCKNIWFLNKPTARGDQFAQLIDIFKTRREGKGLANFILSIIDEKSGKFCQESYQIYRRDAINFSKE